ncbi:MAG: LPXTG cell wall anchor domain-containing protein [Ktedonobacteraceae bacterium]
MRPTVREPILQVNTSRGTPIVTRYGQIIPLIRVVKVRWPGGALVWNRPAAIEVQQGDSERKMPIQNVTERANFAIVLTGLVLTLGMSLFLKRRRKHHHD